MISTTISQAIALLSTRIDSLWSKVVSQATETGRLLQYLYDRLGTQQVAIISNTSRIDDLENAIGGLTFDPATLKGSIDSTAFRVLNTLASSGFTPNASGEYSPMDVFSAISILGNLGNTPGTYQLTLTDGVLKIEGLELQDGDQVSFVLAADGSVQLSTINDQPSGLGIVNISPDPTTDPITALNAEISANFMAAVGL